MKKERIEVPQHKKRCQRDYNLGFKLSLVSRVEKDEMTYKQAQRLYGIQGRSIVLVWLGKHGSLDWLNPSIYSMNTPDQIHQKTEEENQPRSQRNKKITDFTRITTKMVLGKLVRFP